MSKFAERLRTLRDDMGLSQKDLADFVGTSKSSINMYERGEREPGFRMQENLADFFNVSIDFLLGRKDVEVEDITPYTDELGLDHLGSFIKKSRESRGFSIQELSEETRIPEKTLKAYENDTISVKSNVLKKFLMCTA